MTNKISRPLNKFVFNRLIQDERRFMMVSQEVFGKILGVDGKTISAYENNQILPSAEVICKLLAYFKYRLLVLDRFDNETIYE